jgi:hypothetical protein
MKIGDNRSEYLAHFYTFNCIKNTKNFFFINRLILPVKNLNRLILTG